MEISELYELFLASKGVNTDTRTLQPGQIFVALKGETFDGNAYAMRALESGASYAIVNDYVEADDPRLVKFPDTLQALKELAAFHRSRLEIPVRNTGPVAADEIVQLYVRRPQDAEGPLETLRGFRRVHVEPGQTVTLSFPLTAETFLAWSPKAGDMVPIKGEWELLYGPHSADLQSLRYKY